MQNMPSDKEVVMKRKIIIALLSIVSSFALICGLSACSPDKDIAKGINYYLLKDGTYGIGNIRSELTDEEVVIPSTYKDKPITAIVDYGFKDTKITSVTIPDSVTKIG